MTDSCQHYDVKLWALYLQTQFGVGADFRLRPLGAVITACNPEGHILSQEANRQRMAELKQRLNELALAYQPLVGMSPDGQHREASLLVECSREQALALCQAFRQNAYYWLQHEQLWLVPALHPGPELAMGPFRERLITGQFE